MFALQILLGLSGLQVSVAESDMFIKCGCRIVLSSKYWFGLHWLHSKYKSQK